MPATCSARHARRMPPAGRTTSASVAESCSALRAAAQLTAAAASCARRRSSPMRPIRQHAATRALRCVPPTPRRRAVEAGAAATTASRTRARGRRHGTARMASGAMSASAARRGRPSEWVGRPAQLAPFVARGQRRWRAAQRRRTGSASARRGMRGLGAAVWSAGARLACWVRRLRRRQGVIAAHARSAAWVQLSFRRVRWTPTACAVARRASTLWCISLMAVCR